MRLHDQLSEYIASIVPQKVPKWAKRNIALEYESHIDEKMEYYREQGCSEEDAQGKALEDMGAPEILREQFAELYREKHVMRYCMVCLGAR